MKFFPVPLRLLKSVAAGVFCVTLSPAAGASTNSTPLKIVVGSPAGGTTDTLARLLASDMANSLARPVLVENRPGAGGNIAADYVSRAAPDGSVIYMAFTSHTINPSLYDNLRYDAVKDFTPITLVARVPSVLIAQRDAPVEDIASLISYAKERPGELNFAIGGVGSSIHLAGEQFKAQTGVNIVNIPYKGTAPALTDVIGGQVQLMFVSAVAALPHAGGGKIKFLGVTSNKRLSQYPNVPPISDTIPGFESSAWFGLLGPADMPKEVLDPIYKAIRGAIDSPEFQQRLAAEAAEPMNMTPEQFKQFLEDDLTHWADIVAKSGAKAE